MNLLKSLVFAVLVPGAGVILVPYLLLTYLGGNPLAPIGPIRYLGLPMMLLGAGAALWCTVDFARKGRGTPAPIDPPKKLVVEGLYRLSRNPMYTGILLILFGEALYFAAPILLAYALFVFICFHLFTVLYEEPTLLKLFGHSYVRYCSRVPRWIPRRKSIE